MISQGYAGLEYVVIDGESADGSASIIKRYERDLAYWVTEPDYGHAHALNKGFSQTTGEIMCWINSSDMHYPWTLETVAESSRSSQKSTGSWCCHPTSISTGGRGRSCRPPPLNLYDILAGHYLGSSRNRSLAARALGAGRRAARPEPRVRPTSTFGCGSGDWSLVQRTRPCLAVSAFPTIDSAMPGDDLYEREARRAPLALRRRIRPALTRSRSPAAPRRTQREQNRRRPPEQGRTPALVQASASGVRLRPADVDSCDERGA